jgi:hypothetical protein
MANNDKLMRGSYNNARGLRDLTNLLGRNSVGVEVGCYKGESAQIFMDSGQVRKLVCVDSWPHGEWAAAEKDFDQNVARFGKAVEKIKGKSVEVADQFSTQTFNFCYIDANHNYENVKEDIAAWRLKVKAGGIIAGHDFHPTNFPGVVKAVGEAFKAPTATFQDHSWLVRLPGNNFQIVSYVAGEYAKCLAITLPTWLEHSKAERIVIYTDVGDLANLTDDKRVEIRPYFKTRANGMVDCWRRKIEILIDAYNRCPTKFFCWLDADIYVAAPFKEAFFRMGSHTIGATRMFNTTDRGRGEANAGVIFFRHEHSLEKFFHDWSIKSQELEATGKAGIWFEQCAMSKLVHEAFHGMHRYTVAPLTDNLYNLEDDNTRRWFERIDRHKPKLIHLKQGRWQAPDNIERLALLSPQIKAYWDAKPE